MPHLSNVKKSTTDFVDPLDPTKHVTKITITNRQTKPVTEFNDKYKRQSNSMFMSGNYNTTTSARFSKVNASPAESQLVVNSPTREGNGESTNLVQSHYIPADGHGMSTSMYMGTVVTNRLIGGAGSKKPDATQSSRKSNLYHSQSFSKIGNSIVSTRTEVKQDPRLFTVPQKVQQFLDNSHNEIKYVQKDVLDEKAKMNAELNSIEESILQIIQKKRVHLNKMYDDYIETFKMNVQELKDKVVVFKDSSEWAKLQASENGDRLVRLTDIVYYSKRSDDGVYGEYKREPHKNICELRNLKQEVSKHNLEFFAGELEKMSTHPPSFANTPSSAEYLRDCKQRLLSAVTTNFEDFGQLAFSATHVKFSEVLAEPQIFTSLGESRLNCLTNMRDLSSSSIIASRTANLSHTSPITCLLNIDDESFATGDESGVLHVFNHQLWKESHKFKMNGVSSVTSLGRIRTTYDLVEGGKEMRASQSEFKEKHDKNIFLISGHAKPDCMISIWDLKKQAFIKQLKGHSDDVTAISSLQDGHTLFTGAKNGIVHIYNITKKNPVKTFNSLVKAAVNCLYTFNDLSKFAVGFANGEIMIMTIVYVIDSAEKLAICSTCEMLTTLKDRSGVQAINESHIDVGKLITGHEDKTVKIWDFAKGVVLKEILANQTSVLGLLIIENPFAYDLEENYHIISCGEHQEDIYFNLPKQNKNFQLKFQVSFDLSGSRGRNPRLQLYRGNGDNSEEGINLATFINGAESRQLLLISIK